MEDGNLYEGDEPVGHIRRPDIACHVMSCTNDFNLLVLALQLALNDIPGWQNNANGVLRRLEAGYADDA